MTTRGAFTGDGVLGGVSGVVVALVGGVDPGDSGLGGGGTEEVTVKGE